MRALDLPRDPAVRKAFKGIVGNIPADRSERTDRFARRDERRQRAMEWAADRSSFDGTAALDRLYDPRLIRKRKGDR